MALICSMVNMTDEAFKNCGAPKILQLAKNATLTMLAVSNFLRAPRQALGEERLFALVGGLRISNLGSLFIVGVKNSVRRGKEKPSPCRKMPTPVLALLAFVMISPSIHSVR